MRKIIKQSVGIDISKNDFTACVGKQFENQIQDFSGVKSFSNDKAGFNKLLRWVKKESDKSSCLPVYLMEATGVYYENLAYHLKKVKKVVHVVLPNTSKHYAASLNVKTKTDGIDAKVLGRFALERNHKSWEPPKPVFLELRNLTRYYLQLQEQKTSIRNIKHSKDESHHMQKFILQSNEKLIDQLDKQLKKCIKEIESQINSDTELKSKVEKLLTIKGVGLITIATILAETIGFRDVRNIKQLVSYAGYDVVQRESGSSVKGKTRISKKGNRYIRNSLYFPAMVACRYNKNLKDSYLRIIKNKPSKMIGQVAIQRRLLALIYSLWKNNTTYIEGYKKSSPDNKSKATQDSPVKELLKEQ